MSPEDDTIPGTLGRMRDQLQRMEANLDFVTAEVRRFRERLVVVEEHLHDLETHVSGAVRGGERDE